MLQLVSRSLRVSSRIRVFVAFQSLNVPLHRSFASRSVSLIPLYDVLRVSLDDIAGGVWFCWKLTTHVQVEYFVGSVVEDDGGVGSSPSKVSVARG